MNIRLRQLDSYPISYSNPVSVILDNNPMKVVGECEIYTDDKMNHFGKIEFFEPVDENRLVYIVNKDLKPYDNLPLEFISLHEQQYKDKVSRTLKDSKI